MGVEFDEGNFQRRDFASSEQKGMTGWLIKKGIAKDEKGANVVQIMAAIIFFGLAIYFAFR